MRVFLVWKRFGVTELVALVTTREKAEFEIGLDRERNPHEANPVYRIEEREIEE